MIICYGSLNPDLVHSVPRLPRLGEDISADRALLTYGGGAANAAVALARWGGDPALIGNAVGTDPLGAWLLDDLADRGVDVSHVETRDDATTPHIVVLSTPDGERTVVGSRYQDVHWTRPSADIIGSARAVLVDGYSAGAGAALAELGASLDVPVVGVDVVVDVARHAALIVWSGSEHTPAEVKAATSETTVVMTNGAKPVSVYAGQRHWEVQPPEIDQVDSLGAGDTFAAMCAFGVSSGWDLEDTIAAAAAAGALSAAQPRGAPPPTLEEIEATR